MCQSYYQNRGGAAMIRAIITALACLLIAGCAGQAPEPKIVTQEIKVEAPTKRPVPAKLMECGRPDDPSKPPEMPKWLVVEAHPDWAALDKDGQKLLRAMIVTLAGCNAAWRAWASAP